jgi:copper chaperone CopZ
MTSMMKLGVLSSVVAAAAVFCPLCDGGIAPAGALSAREVVQASDTATVRLRISGMTCGTCPATARLAIKKLPGVFSAEVTYKDSLGVVRYDPSRVTPAQIAAHLTKLTGYRATILPDVEKSARPQERG